jgi:hypothetical protein
MKSGKLNFLGLSRPLQDCNGTALPLWVKLRRVYTSQNIAKLIKFLGQDPVRCKLAVDNK